MKKKIFCVIALVAGLISCTEDYTNWANPQSNKENPTAEALAFAVQPTVSYIDFATETSETVQLFTSNLTTNEYIVEFTGEGSENKATLIANSDGIVSVSDLAEAVATVYGGESVERTLNVSVSGSFTFSTDDGNVIVPKEADPFTMKAKLSSGSKIDTEPILYLTGDHYNWGNPWVPLVPVWGDDVTSWIIIYLHEGEQFKFAPQAGWGDDFGMSATIIDEAGVNPSGDDNIVVGNAGWYLIKVINKEDYREVKFMKPNIYLIGETAVDGWNISDSGLYSIPDSETGLFVSPAFVKDAEVRMCVKFDDIDWWKTEFIVNAQGQIDFRAGGDDQARVNVKEGQQCYLNFSGGSGVYK